MMRMRRYRVFLIFAVFVIAALYHFRSFGDLESDELTSFGPGTDDGSTPIAPESPNSAPEEGEDQQEKLKGDDYKEESLEEAKDLPSADSRISQASLQEPPVDIPSPIQTSQVVEPFATSIAVPDQDAVQTPSNYEVSEDDNSSLPAIDPDNSSVDKDEGRLEISEDFKPTTIHWSKIPEHFPIPSASLIPLPTGKPKPIPKIQYVFSDESASEKIDREQKLDLIKKSFARSWAGYKEKAWLHDELSPVSGSYRDPFAGWGATLVDSLDSLWILGMKEEFEEATNALKGIDFTTTDRNDIPLFETVIRYLGGLLGAYDLSSGTYRVLLDKAVELAEILMGAFDTPNRMPMTFYLWKPTFSSQPHRARTRVVLAELGSLSLEFTRLAQITREAKYYDAIARITNDLEVLQNATKLPGLWPMIVDASGCKKPDVSSTSQLAHSALNGPGASNAGFLHSGIPTKNVSGTADPPGNFSTSTMTKVAAKQPKTEAPEIIDEMGAGARKTKPTVEELSQSKVGLVKRQIPSEDVITHDSSTVAVDLEKEPDCEMQGLVSPPSTITEEFSLGGQADSAYEYLPKQYMLLGGLEDVYRSMYETAANTATKNLLYRPMLPKGRNVLLSGRVKTNGLMDDLREMKLTPEGTHLTCFAGGMFAIGAKIFDREEDMEIAKKLADGCVWAYEVTTTGIMPETYLAVDCESQSECAWNETLYRERIDPYWEHREEGRKAQIQQQQDFIRSKQRPATKKVANNTGIEHYEKTEDDELGSSAESVVQEKSDEANSRAKSTGSGEVDLNENASPAGAAVQAKSDKPRPKAGSTSQSAEPNEQAEDKEALSYKRSMSETLDRSNTISKAIRKRQLGDIENEIPLKPESKVNGTPTGEITPPEPKPEPEPEPELEPELELEATDNKANSRNDTPDVGTEAPEAEPIANWSSDIAESAYPPIQTQEEFINAKIRDEHIPPGMTQVTSTKYILRPEAIESVFILYRTTGDPYWREKGWAMFQAIEKHTATQYGSSAIGDVTSDEPTQLDEMESFWLAETLKYFFLLFSDPSVISLDDYVLNTEAHPFRRPKPT